MEFLSICFVSSSVKTSPRSLSQCNRKCGFVVVIISWVYISWPLSLYWKDHLSHRSLIVLVVGKVGELL
ncbi:hypothetical protein GDO81_001059 [Engystomops pustulosus]|uniref:Uncharacterized protein n=1 Tax=Engystomops pustulosus TaxID=76066 RepID=A0AAV7DAX6_ENGPU|nr:hypothetical protein GDO81_001059 [Engystomops pustulosus]